MKTVTILLKPNFNNTLSKMGYDQNEDYNENSVAFQQGFDIQSLEVNAGEKFTISDNFECGYLDCEGEEMRVIYESDFEDDIIDDDQIEFSCGTYLFHEVGTTFEKID